MNFSIIKRTLGWILLFEAIFLLIPAVTAAVYWEEEFFSFLMTILLCAERSSLGALHSLVMFITAVSQKYVIDIHAHRWTI